MSDVFTIAKRSEVMSLIRSRGNKDTELKLITLMQKQGITGWRRHLKLRVGKLGVERRKGGGDRALKTGSVSQLSTLRSQLKVRPDFVFRAQRVAVFVDGCFWHGCPRHATRPKQNRVFWDAKIARNRARDRKVSRALRAAGWSVLRVWECALTAKRSRATMARLARAVREGG